MPRAVLGAMLGATLGALALSPLTGGVAHAGKNSRGDGGALLAKAQKAIDEIDYEVARDLTRRALASGDLDPKEVVLAYQIAGETAAALGDDEEATDQFLRWILLEPDAELADGVSPKISEPFTGARASANLIGGFSVKFAVTNDDGLVSATLEVRDPKKLVRAVRLRLADGHEAKANGTHVELATDEEGELEVTVSALDEHGNELVRRNISVKAVEAAKPVAGGDDPDDDDDTAAPKRTKREVKHRGFPAFLRWPTWTGVAAIAAAGAFYFNGKVATDEDDLAALNASSEEHTYDEARAIELRGESHARYANVCLGFAAAGAIAAVLTLVLEPHDVEVQPVVGPDSAGASATLRF